MSAYVCVLSTGGTIASTSGEDGAEPSKTGDELVEAAPIIDEYAEISVEQVAQRPSFDMDFETISAVAQGVEQAVADRAGGVVITHGTDTMEESAYFLDQTLDVDAPVVFTGAQRRPDEISPDGPANLATAVHAAANERFCSTGGVYVAFDEEIHAARTVTKTHTSKLSTFGSPGAGPVASETRDGFRFHRAPENGAAPFEPSAPTATVRIVPSAAGVGRASIDEAVEAGVDGLVLSGTGLGNATTALGDAVADAIDSDVPVVVASRCLAGETRAVYGGGGGGETLRTHGVGFAGALPAQKARIELALAIEQADDPLETFDSA